MGYKTEKLNSGVLLVRDVEIMSVQDLSGDKKFKNTDINEEWMFKALQTFADNKAKGKMPYLWDRHNSKDQAAQVIGRLDNLRIGQYNGAPWIIADVIITDPTYQQKFLEGKVPSKSAEYQPDNYYLRGVALLDGHEGHFDFEVPDFVPEGLYEELVALGLDPDAQTVLCHSTASTATVEIDMTKEEFQAMLAENNKTLLAEVDKKLAAGKPTASGDIDEAIDAVREQERAQAEVKLAKARKDAKIAAYTAQLHAKTKTPESLITKKLSSFSTDEGMDEYFKSAMKMAEADVKLGMEREATGEPDLVESYDEYKRNHPDTKLGLNDYIQLQKRAEVPHDVRFAGRKINQVTFA